jgi:hypothetical protein
MKDSLRKLFAPILNIFEGGEEPYNYRPSHRKILIAVGSLYFGSIAGGAGAYIPTVVFLLVSTFCFVVGGLGSDRAVARIWGSK